MPRDEGQANIDEAADCLGLTRLQTILHVVLLPAMERVYPALSSQFVLLMLASSITSQISAEELTATANLVQSDTYRSFEVYIVVAGSGASRTVTVTQARSRPGPPRSRCCASVPGCATPASWTTPASAPCRPS